jgi:serine/threonine protein kinase
VDSREPSGIVSQPELFAGRFEILARLGTGLVGEVSRARDMQDPNDKDGGVALKILRPGQDPGLIKSEALTLQALWREEEKLKDGFHTAPRLIVADPQAPRPFLAMEFIRGEQIPKLLYESKTRHFDEATGLNAAIQLFRLLSIVHEGLNKTYIDLKMENLWWQEENGGRLKVTDWNVLEERHSTAAGKIDPVSIDLFHASVFLYWMLTGELPDLQGNLKVRRLQRALNWDELSDGAKNLLSGLFARKFETAMQAWGELERVLQYWKMDPASLISKAKELVSSDVDKAGEIVSILRKRNVQPDKDFSALERALKEIGSQRDDPSKSIALFNAGSYSAAQGVIENASPHTSYPHVFRWWRQAVELTAKAEPAIKKSMADSNPDEKVERVRKLVVEAVKAYFSERFADAEQYFSKLTRDLPNEPEITSIYEDLLDVLIGLKFYAQAESQREQASDENKKTQRDLYTKAMENYEQARSKALTVAPAILPEALSPVTLQDSIDELLNATKVLSKAAKGNQYFKNGQMQSAMGTWRDGFRLDPDHPELTDLVLSAASKSVDNGALNQASMLLDLIPMAGYLLACSTLRGKISQLRQDQPAQDSAPPLPKIMPGDERAASLDAVVADSKKQKPAKSASSGKGKKPKSPPPQKMPAKTPAGEANKEAPKATAGSSVDETKAPQPGDNAFRATAGPERTGEAPPEKPNAPANRKKPKPDLSARKAHLKRPTAKSKQEAPKTPAVSPAEERKEPQPGNNASQATADSGMTPEVRIKKQTEFDELGNEIAKAQKRTLTLDQLEEYVKKARPILESLDPSGKSSSYIELRGKLEEYSQQWETGVKLWKEAWDASLEERERKVKNLKDIGFIGKAENFETELGLNEIVEIKKASNVLNIFSLQFLERKRKQFENDLPLKNYIDKQINDFKKRVTGKTLHEPTFPSDPKLIRALKDLWPDDPEVSQAFEQLKTQALGEKPKDWSIERLRKLARIYPAGYREEMKKHRAKTFIILEYDNEIKNIDQQVENLSPKVEQQLNGAYILSTVKAYRERLEEYIGFAPSDKSISIPIDEYVELYKELKGTKG